MRLDDNVGSWDDGNLLTVLVDGMVLLMMAAVLAAMMGGEVGFGRYGMVDVGPIVGVFGDSVTSIGWGRERGFDGGVWSLDVDEGLFMEGDGFAGTRTGAGARTGTGDAPGTRD